MPLAVLILFSVLTPAAAGPPPPPSPWDQAPAAWLPQRRLALGTLARSGVDAPEASTVEQAVAATAVHALGEGPFTVHSLAELTRFRMDRPWCTPGACNLELGRALEAQVVLGGQLTTTAQGVGGLLHLQDTVQGTTLAWRPFSGQDLAEATASAQQATTELVEILLQMDRAAVRHMFEGVVQIPGTAEPAAASAPVTDHTRAEPLGWSLRELAAAAAAGAPIVGLATLALLPFWPLLMVPGVNVVVLGVWMLHPLLAGAAGWAAAAPASGRRVALGPVMMASLVAEASVLAPVLPLLLLPLPVQLPILLALTPALAATQVGTTAIMLKATGRPRHVSDGLSEVDLLSVPPPQPLRTGNRTSVPTPDAAPSPPVCTLRPYVLAAPPLATPSPLPDPPPVSSPSPHSAPANAPQQAATNPTGDNAPPQRTDDAVDGWTALPPPP